MNLIVKTKLLPTQEQHQFLLETMVMFNEACSFVSQIAFENKCFNQVQLHHLSYFKARESFPKLPSQFIVRAIDKVAQSYKLNKTKLHKFKKHGAMVYDDRLYSIKSVNTLSLGTISGRQKIAFIFGQYSNFENIYNERRYAGQADLTFERGKFYLNIVAKVPEEPEYIAKEFLGIDLGIVNIVTTSDNVTYSGEQITKTRKRYTKVRSNLQSCGSKSAKRHLKKISGKQARFQKNINHTISKQIVQCAKGTERGIALEDLKGISRQKTVSRAQRQSLSNWAFFQLDSFIEYKAKRVGVPVRFVNPAYTSQTCSRCGYISELNRKIQALFKCQDCGTTLNADYNAALNISGAAVNRPIVAGLT